MRRLAAAALLAALCAGLGWLATVEALRLAAADETAFRLSSDLLAAPAAAPREEAPPEFTPPELSAFDAALERPLFSETRRPPEEAVAPEIELDAPEPAELTLRAVVRSGADRIALLESAGDGALSRLREGERLAGWRVLRIDAESVTLAGDGRELTLALAYAPQAAPRPAER